jgi:hypothetical protein
MGFGLGNNMHFGQMLKCQMVTTVGVGTNSQDIRNQLFDLAIEF